MLARGARATQEPGRPGNCLAVDPAVRRRRVWKDDAVHEPFPERDIVTFYQTRYLEDDRLRVSPHGRLEFLRTQELLRRYLPEPPARILDVGGATGVHASWLVEAGYTVHVVDAYSNLICLNTNSKN